ncbi:hypothetical protein OpiT1DRAFT_02642 [Opitutaceae bacterium TAV1]|nr:hypothetical protein OPIT5_08495 [Opitutaceae bacterium TAV5]EIP98190.1 hypothetical protein OpiT1DRAFT_02642 [Opitutaceae bacterium TAV1]
MRTTLDLPSDVTAALRRESAQRGGRGKAPMNLLVAEAVRLAYNPEKTRLRARIVTRRGRGLVVMPKGIRITSGDVNAALEDM